MPNGVTSVATAEIAPMSASPVEPRSRSDAGCAARRGSAPRLARESPRHDAAAEQLVEPAERDEHDDERERAVEVRPGDGDDRDAARAAAGARDAWPGSTSSPANRTIAKSCGRSASAGDATMNDSSVSTVAGRRAQPVGAQGRAGEPERRADERGAQHRQPRPATDLEDRGEDGLRAPLLVEPGDALDRVGPGVGRRGCPRRATGCPRRPGAGT